MPLMLERLVVMKHAVAASEKEAAVPLKHALCLEDFPLLLFPASQVFWSHASARVGLAQQVGATGRSCRLVPHRSACQVRLILWPSPPCHSPPTRQSPFVRWQLLYTRTACGFSAWVCVFLRDTRWLLQGGSNLSCHFSWQLICH